MRNSCRLGRLLLSLLSLAISSEAFATSDAEFQRLIAAPDDPVLNRQFAVNAEMRGDLRHALAAIERALNAQPGDRELLAEYARLRRKMLPSVTSVTVQIGASYSSNPRELGNSSARKTNDGILDAAISVEDERTLGDLRIRSLGFLAGQWEPRASELSSGILSFQSGPVFLLGQETWLHLAPGVAVAWLDGHELYSQISGAATIGTVYRGLTQTVTARYGWREGNGDVAYSDAQLVEVLGRFVVSPSLVKGDYLYFEPRYHHGRPEDMEPASAPVGQILVSRDVSPPGYDEWGGRISYFIPLSGGDVYVGAGISVFERNFDSYVLDPVALAAGVPIATNRWREDLYVEPTAHIIFPDLIAPKIDLRADYRLEHNDSNDAYRDYINHVVGMRVVGRF